MSAADSSRQPGPSPRPRWPAVALGGFVVWQLFFILASNLLPLVHRPSTTAGAADLGPEAQVNACGRVVGLLEEALGHWSNLTGQLQGWSLYAPHVPTQATFVAVELRWDDAADWPVSDGRRVRLHSAVEPDDPRHFFRPFCTFRLPAYEANLGLVTWAWNEAAAAREPEVWRRRIADAVRRQGKPMLAYLQWRLRAYEQEHPQEPPPAQVILLARVYRIPPPEGQPGAWSEPVEKPIARWRPGVEVAPGYLPLKSYYPAAHRFEPVPVRE